MHWDVLAAADSPLLASAAKMSLQISGNQQESKRLLNLSISPSVTSHKFATTAGHPPTFKKEFSLQNLMSNLPCKKEACLGARTHC